MHGLINRSIQSYVCDSYGMDIWIDVTQRADLDFTEFEAMLSYDDAATEHVLNAVSEVLGRPRDELMEDIGTYLVSHPSFEAVRRLLRFGGVNFEDFLHSLDDLPDRARLAVSDLHLPKIELREHADGQFSLICDAPVAGYGHVMMGILRVMADDYGALALLEQTGGGGGVEIVSITLVEAEYAEGRSFDLGARVG
ncbi:MAG: heme NO-binding domain-containing protein [Sulfitobacter sp.]